MWITEPRWRANAMTEYDTNPNKNSGTTADGSTDNQTTIYLAGEGGEWKTNLKDLPLYAQCGVNFTTSADDHQNHDIDGVLTKLGKRSWAVSTGVGEHRERDVALCYLLDALDHEPMPFSTWEGHEDAQLGIEGPTPLKSVLEVFDNQQFGTSVSLDQIRESVDDDVNQVLTLLESVNVVASDGRGDYQLVDRRKTKEVLDAL